MKRSGFVLFLLIFTFSNSILAQNHDGNPNAKKMSFYSQLAQKDAAYEQSLVLHSEKDELDFWKDQKRYEQDLKKSDEAAYRTYMKEKIEAYHQHFASCSISCYHTKQHLEKAKTYLSYSNEENDRVMSENRVLENFRKGRME
ncbi:hypothetical protein J0X14_15880 [Muricauda sp. CAU 1633]|uniref:hypothetical protein n=1 Tax=Allomuricauda sp. CAU 1633 TaxID=2816036 RepID=UPI001A8E4B2C|nr:hypothetical protein [Muricauda sp. CAU 1633]MBO0323790.1 hypothetical protein [Muricauda sp. CAU 1633]